MKQHHYKGFTLIELLITLVLIGVLLVSAAASFLSVDRDAKVAVLKSAAQSMQSGLEVVNAKSRVQNKYKGEHSITINGESLTVFNGYPAVRGRDSFNELSRQIKLWLDVDAVSLTQIRADQQAAPFFIDKSTRNNQIYVFFSSDLDSKSVLFNCYIRYQNPSSGSGPEVLIRTEDC